MVFILGASSLHRAIKELPINTQKRLRTTVYTSPGLSFNQVNAKNKSNTVQHLVRKFFSDKENLLIWHDVVNNSLSKYPGNNFTALSPSKFLEVVRGYSQVKALLYVQRDGTPDIFDALKREKLLTLHILKDLISKRKAKQRALLLKYRDLHPETGLELKSLRIVSNHCSNLKRLQKSRRPRLNLKRRLAMKQKQASTEASNA